MLVRGAGTPWRRPPPPPSSRVPRDLREAQHASEWVLKSNDSFRERPEHHLVEVTREDEAFVRWMEAHERDSIPWMRSVLEALTAAHADKLREEWLRKMRREALRGKEAKRMTDTSWSIAFGSVCTKVGS